MSGTAVRQKKAAAKSCDLNSSEVAEYIALCKGVGYVPVPKLLDQILHLELGRSSISIKEYDDVRALLGGHCGVVGWGWRPLREEDSRILANDVVPPDNGMILEGAYAHFVPLSALRKVKDLCAIPGIYFFVSEYMRDLRNGDDPQGKPIFLAVSGIGLPWYVIDSW